MMRRSLVVNNAEAEKTQLAIQVTLHDNLKEFLDKYNGYLTAFTPLGTKSCKTSVRNVGDVIRFGMKDENLSATDGNTV